MGKMERIMLKELEEAGYKYRDIHEIFKQKKIASEVVQIILKWLPDIYAEHLGSGDQLVRSLISAEEPFDPTRLLDLFETGDYNFAIKSGIAIVLIYAPTDSIEDWIKSQLINEPYALERMDLVSGLDRKGGFKSKHELLNFTRLIFDKYPINAFFDIYKKYADEDDIDFLLDKMNIADAKKKKEISKLIIAIQKRKKVYKFP